MRKWNGKRPRPELTNNFWPKSLWEEQHTDTDSDVTGPWRHMQTWTHARSRENQQPGVEIRPREMFWISDIYIADQTPTFICPNITVKQNKVATAVNEQTRKVAETHETLNVLSSV